jgi:hypothetical protein
MSTVRRFGASSGAAVLTVVGVTLLSHYVMDNAINTTMSGLAGAIAFFVVWSLTKR